MHDTRMKGSRWRSIGASIRVEYFAVIVVQVGAKVGTAIT